MSVIQRRPSTWQIATGSPRVALRALRLCPLVITQAMWWSASQVKPIGVTCGVPSACRELKVARCRS
jgi:hypothetical protein